MRPENAELSEAFLRQLAAHEAAVRAYVRRLVPTRHDAADVMQEVALVLWQKFDGLGSTDIQPGHLADVPR